MKHFLSFTALFFLNIISAQNISNLTGTWINYKTEMKDGSRLYTGFSVDSIYGKYIIEKNKLCMNSNPVNQIDYRQILSECLDYKLINNEIQTSQYSGFVVERLSNDSLTLSEKINDTPEDKLKRLYFVREEILIAQYKDKYKNKTNIKASSKFTPKTKKSFMKLLYEDFKKRSSFYNLRLSGKILIFPKEKKVETKITYSTRKDSLQINKIATYLNNSFEDWDLTGFNTYESIELPFIFEVKKDDLFKGINVLFFTNNVNEFDTINGIKLDKMAGSSDYFKKAILLFQDKQFLKAADFFGKSFDLDPRNIDALYNEAASFAELGNKEDACKIWKQISDYGQISGKKLYLNNCN